MWWYLTYFHEAGHAVAARDRKRPVNEIFIEPDHGYTRHGTEDTKYQDDDHQFIVWAGPWAEARACWAFQGKGKHGENAGEFIDDARSLLRKNGHDWREFHEAMGRTITDADVAEARMAYDTGGEPPKGEYAPDDQWDGLLDGMWLQINTLATNLMAEAAIIHVDPRQEIMVRMPKLWRRWGWQPPEDKHENPD
jgi:hypothetical protein